MRCAIEMGWFVINNYYTVTGDVPVYTATILLDPSKRDAYIRQNWLDEWYESAVGGAREIWAQEYNVQLHDDVSTVTKPVAKPVRHKDNQLALLMKDVEVKTTISRTEDNFMGFITSSPIAIGCTPLE